MMLKNRKNEDKVLAPTCDVESMKICKPLNFSVPVQFFREDERMCHLVIDRCVEPTMYFNGGKYGVVCSYDLVEKKITSLYKSFDSVGMPVCLPLMCMRQYAQRTFGFACCWRHGQEANTPGRSMFFKRSTKWRLS